MDVAVMICAIVGATLGIWNFILRHWEGLVRLKVIPQHYYSVQGKTRGLAVRVINLSTFAVTVSAVSLVLSDSTKALHSLLDTQLPKRLEPRQALDVVYPHQLIGDPNVLTVTRARAETACGTIAYATGRILKEYLELAREHQGVVSATGGQH